MLRPSPSALRWVLAIAMVCLLLALPLHQAQHASEPVSAAAQAQPGSVQPDHGEREAAADACLWCLFHAQPLAPGGTPPEFRFHAEADTPPTQLPAGLAARHCALAADPRGPPTA